MVLRMGLYLHMFAGWLHASQRRLPVHTQHATSAKAFATCPPEAKSIIQIFIDVRQDIQYGIAFVGNSETTISWFGVNAGVKSKQFDSSQVILCHVLPQILL